MCGLFLVADGCGGMANGEMVSSFLAESFKRIWEDKLPKILSFRAVKREYLLSSFISWLEQVNKIAYGFGARTGEANGSTLTLLLTLDRRFYVFNVGDSRAYLYRQGRMTQLSQDQTLVADMLRNNEISLEEAESFKYQNALTMCVGSFEKLQIFNMCGRLRRGDIFLLCSDGLYKEVSLEELAGLLSHGEIEADELRRLIPYGGARDNVSVLIVQAGL